VAVLTTFTVGGLDVRDYVTIQTHRIEKRAGNRSVASFSYVDPIGNFGSLRPVIREQVYIALDGVATFLGIVWRCHESHIINTVGFAIRVECVDYAALLEHVYFNGGLPAGFLHEVAAPLVANLAPHGIIQSQTVVQPGPAVGVQTFPFVTIAQAMNDLALESGWMWRVAPVLGTTTPAFGFYEVGTMTAPQDFDTAQGSVEHATFSQDMARYVNEIWIRYGEGEAQVTQRLLGDGVTREWRLENDMVEPYPGNVQVVRAAGTTDETFDTDYINGTFAWHYDRANVWNQRMVHDDSLPVLLSGEYADLTYVARFPNAVLARNDTEYLGYGPFTRVEDLPAVFDRATALAYAEAQLRRFGGTPKLGRVRTAVAGYEPLQVVNVTLPNIGVSESEFLITEVVARHRETSAGSVHHFVYEVALVEGNEANENWLDFYLPPRRNRGFGVVPSEGAGGVGGEQPPTTTPGVEWVTGGLTCYPIGARGVSLDTVSSAAWTNTSWVEVLPSASAPSVFWVIAGIHVEGVVDTSEVEFDIALGLSGEEQVVATVALAGAVNSSPGVFLLPIPHGPIAPGTRVSMRCRYDDYFGQAVDTQWVKLLYYTAQPNGITVTTRVLACYPSATNVVTATGHASAWTNPASWTEIIAATPAAWQLAGLCVRDPLIGGFNAAGDEVEIDVGIGAAASETVVQTYRFHFDQSTHVGVFHQNDVLVNQIPIGSRVAWRFRNRRGTSVNFGIKLVIYAGSLS
jgi:hypothetical protein